MPKEYASGFQSVKDQDTQTQELISLWERFCSLFRYLIERIFCCFFKKEIYLFSRTVPPKTPTTPVMSMNKPYISQFRHSPPVFYDIPLSGNSSARHTPERMRRPEFIKNYYSDGILYGAYPYNTEPFFTILPVDPVERTASSSNIKNN